MGRFSLFTGNRIERLAAELARTLERPLPDPLAGEIVIVQHRGMARWLSMQLACRHGVAANLRFLFPRVFLYETASRLTGVPPGDDYEPDWLRWRIFGLLPACLADPDYGALERYLREDPSGLKRSQLASAIARAFDRYLIFRPELIGRWEEGERPAGAAAWQADLWRRLRAGIATDHLAALRGRIRRALASGAGDGLLPARVAIFGIQALPPFYLDFFGLLATRTDVNGFFMNPCREFWTEIRSEREIGRIVRRARMAAGAAETTREALLLERGNPLLASLGRQGRDFFTRLFDLPAALEERFEEPGRETLLRIVQSDLLNLRDPENGDGPIPRIPGHDRSLQFHSCHGPLREIEVLHDQLLQLFADDPALLPAEVVVMAPDIDTFAPLVEAVFGSGRRGLPGEGPIPYSIADRAARHEGSLLRALVAILELSGGRFGAARVLSLLESPPIRRRFRLSAADAGRLRGLVFSAGIRWGFDPEDRARSGVPPTPENTWRAGFDRLLLGYALPGDGERLILGIAPCDGVEGKEAEPLGRFIGFVESLFALRSRLATPRTLSQWVALLHELLATFFEADGEAEREELRQLRRSIEAIGAIERRADFRDAVEFPVLRALLDETFAKSGSPYGYLTGGVTFCAMVPMRSVPARVVCLIGMNGADYPRRDHPVDFDLLQLSPRMGDPSRREDDRYLFLEALLSARDTFYVSYSGQSCEDNSPIPPATPVSELFEYVEQACRFEGGGAPERLLTRHFLQPFHPGYFTDDPKRFSYSATAAAAAARLADPVRTQRRFAAGPLPAPEEDGREIPLARLQAFFRNPSRDLLTRRIGLRLEPAGELLPEKEPFTIGGLDRYRLGGRLVDHALGGGDPREMLPLLAAAGELPHGTVGRAQCDTLCMRVGDFVQALRPLLSGRPAAPCPVDLALDGFRIRGTIADLRDAGPVRHRFASLRATDQLALWIDLLLLGAGGHAAAGATALLLGTKGAFRFDLPADPLPPLRELVGRFATGQRAPLPLFPESSLAFAVALHGGKGRDGALAAAEAGWRGDERHAGEGEEPHIRLCFGGEPPFTPEFEQIASAVFGPLVDHRRRHP